MFRGENSGRSSLYMTDYMNNSTKRHLVKSPLRLCDTGRLPVFVIHRIIPLNCVFPGVGNAMIVSIMASGWPNNSITLKIMSLALWLMIFYVAQAAASEKLGECLPSSTDETQFHCFAGLRTITTAATNAKDDMNYYAEDCFDLEEDACPGWAATGECTINPDYMLHHCQYSCQTCIEIDGHGGMTQIAPTDARTAIVQHLMETAEYIRNIIEAQPQLRATCRNYASECTYWAVQGQCIEGADTAPYMLEHCPAACRMCV
jgi:hypothetical protein